MAQQLRQEQSDRTSLITTRTQNSEMWFANNRALELEVLGKLAQYQEKYKFILFAFVFQFDHYHLEGQFPLCNRAAFMRSFNSVFAKIVKKHVPQFGSGTLWERRYAEQCVPLDQDVENYMMYCALQAVNAGLCEKPRDYPAYNSFVDAIGGIEQKYKVVDWSAYHNAKRCNQQVKIQNYTRWYPLKYSRIPGYENLSQKDYKSLMLTKLETRRQALVQERRQSGKNFLGNEKVRKVRPGDRPLNPKKSLRHTHRPIVLCSDIATRNRIISEYFELKRRYQESSERFRLGELEVKFPDGTYRPPLILIWMN